MQGGDGSELSRPLPEPCLNLPGAVSGGDVCFGKRVRSWSTKGPGSAWSLLSVLLKVTCHVRTKGVMGRDRDRSLHQASRVRSLLCCTVAKMCLLLGDTCSPLLPVRAGIRLFVDLTEVKTLDPTCQRTQDFYTFPQ